MSRRPGLLVAVVARSPVFGGKVKSFDAAKAKAVPGVKHVVRISSGVAVVATATGRPKRAGTRSPSRGTRARPAACRARVSRSCFAQQAGQAGAVARHDGDAQGALPGAAAKLDAVYELPYLAHADHGADELHRPRAPRWCRYLGANAVPDRAQGVGAGIGGVPPEKVKVHTTYLGVASAGGSSSTSSRKRSRRPGHRHPGEGDLVPGRRHPERAVSPRVLAPAAGRLDASGQPVAWTHRIVAPSIMARVFPDTVKNGLDGEAVEGGVEMPYSVLNVHVDYSLADTGIRSASGAR